VEDMKRERKAFGKPFGMPATDTDGNVVGPTYEDIGLQEEDEESMPRTHAADTQGDIKSLDRKGQRNLYLLIKAKSGEEGKEVWKFPEGGFQKGGLLHEVYHRFYKCLFCVKLIFVHFIRRLLGI
jgi:large subunit ribosomal protein L46